MQASAKETPFQLIGAAAKPLVLVPSHVNNTGPYNFLLDSGATYCLISPELASNLGIQSESEEEALGGGGAVQLSLARVHSVAVGSAKQENTQVVITHDLERIGAALKVTVDGAIGFTFMKDFRVTSITNARYCGLRGLPTVTTKPTSPVHPFRSRLPHRIQRSCFRHLPMVRDLFNSRWTRVPAKA